jgi:uncharacterized membrane protein YgcG
MGTAEDDMDIEMTPPRRSQQGRMRRDSIESLDGPAPGTRTPQEDLYGTTVQNGDGQAFLSAGGVDDDTEPLTSPPSRSPNDHSPNGSRRGNQFLNVDTAYTSGADTSLSPTNRRRPLSSSTLRRTGELLRQASTRVVNLSHEPDDIEREIRRKSAVPPNSNPLPLPSGSATQSFIELGFGMDGTSHGAYPPPSPISEKMPSPTVEAVTFPEYRPRTDLNPLRGKSLGLLSPTNSLRLWLLNFLVHPLVEPIILILIIIQTVVLAINCASNVYDHPRPSYFGTDWTDWVLLGIFIFYTAEMVIKIMVSGFILNPTEYSTIDRSIGIQKALKKKANEIFTLHRQPSNRKLRGSATKDFKAPDSLLRSFTMNDMDAIPGTSRDKQKKRLAYRAFLRHSFNRLDFVAVVSFWISFVLAAAGIESQYQLYVFRMMSCLRILRLLSITSGTSVILRSLKRAAPTLLNVAFLIGFFWLLFAIIGVQIFKSSLRRQCTYMPGTDGAYTQNMPPPGGSFQFCGGWLNLDGQPMPWLKADGTNGTTQHKGFLCPVLSQCIEGENPYNNTVSFDNIIQSAEMVFVIMTSNTFTDIMYFLTDTDYLAAALFAACGIIFLTFWLVSLLIAVITSSFQVIREESRTSAFTAQDDPAEDHPVDDDEKAERLEQQRPSALKWIYQKSYWFWIVIIVFDLVMHSLRTATMGSFKSNLISNVELIVTAALIFEISFRFVSDWRDFSHHRRNWFDLFLAIITGIIQIPVIRKSGTIYAWLTIFQILRFYRVVLAVQLTRDLILLVLRHVSGIANLIMFVFLLTFLASIFAAQLFRGQLPILDGNGNYVQITFATMFNSFLGMYQILSSENWTSILYNIQRFNTIHNTAWIGSVFFIIWYILANLIVLNMFIAVIQENFDVSEDQKRMQQVRAFLQQKEMGSSGGGTLALSSIFKFGRVHQQDPLDYGAAATEMLLKDAVVRDFLDEQDINPGIRRTSTHLSGFGAPKRANSWLPRIFERVKNSVWDREPNPFYSRLQLTKPHEELDPGTLAREVVDAAERRKVSQRRYLAKHPMYNVSLFIFKHDNPIRKWCQRIVGPGRGVRIEGVTPNPTIWYIFSAFIYLAIVGMVLLACVTTPLFQLEYFNGNRGNKDVSDTRNWFVFSDIGFAALFTIEALIKVVADGFFWTPNAYFHSSWGFIDGVVLVTLWANVVTSLTNPGSGSRAVGAFKALRALRLLNVSDSARDTFHSVIILGGWKVVSAAFVSLSLLIPFAIYGLNLFAGKMDWCNDWQQYDVFNLTDCVGESTFSPNGWDIIGPRRVAPFNTNYDFDTFGDSLFLLFQIVSQEGWVDVMWSAQSITGVFTQPAWFAQQGNAAFFVIFNLLGAVFVLTLFVSVFMRNYTEQTGVAFLTSEQRSWLELRRLLRQVAPSKRPNPNQNRKQWQAWCYRCAVTKNGAWQRSVTVVLILHLILLCCEFYPEPKWWTVTRMGIFFIFLWVYIANVIVRLIGLSWTRFRRSAWDVYALVTVTGTFITAVMGFISLGGGLFGQVHKLFLVSLALLLIPRNNQLDQLFKTAAASFSAISNLLATWFVLFLVYAIAFTQAFGLTRFGPNENDNINFRTVPKALILLFRMSVGENWNQFMIDFANIVPPYCTSSEKYYDGDCGSAQWAYALFVSWNIISMYIFVNLFISLIYESFSYVYQRSSGLSVISRLEIRRFKQAWAEFDPSGKGYITKEQFPRFLGELSGIFEMRIYDGDFTVNKILKDCCVDVPFNTSALPLDLDHMPAKREVDLAKLNARLAEMPIDEVRARRKRMNTFYEEVLVSADPDRGISFNALLMILAHYKVINESKSLKLEEFLRRRARLQRVEEAVHRNIVVGFFDTLYWARRMRRRRDSKGEGRMTAIPKFVGVPEIYVHDEGVSSSSNVGGGGGGGGGGGSGGLPTRRFDVPAVSITTVDPESRSSSSDRTGRPSATSISEPADRLGGISSTGVRSRSNSAQRTTPSHSPTRETTTTHLSPRHAPSSSASGIVQPDWHFAQAIEGTSPPPSPRTRMVAGAGIDGGGSETPTDVAARSRANSALSQNEMMGMFQDSAWGQSMRRSFTMKRGNSQLDRRPSS